MLPSAYRSMRFVAACLWFSGAVAAVQCDGPSGSSGGASCASEAGAAEPDEVKLLQSGCSRGRLGAEDTAPMRGTRPCGKHVATATLPAKYGGCGTCTSCIYASNGLCYEVPDEQYCLQWPGNIWCGGGSAGPTPAPPTPPSPTPAPPSPTPPPTPPTASPTPAPPTPPPPTPAPPSPTPPPTPPTASPTPAPPAPTPAPPSPTPSPTPPTASPTPAPPPTSGPTPSPTAPPVPTPPAPALVQRLVNALNQVDYQFLKLQPTAGEDCNIEKADTCMEPSEVYFWSDMVEAVSKMAGTGVGSEKLYAGTAAPDGHKYALANIAAFLAQTMQETIQYDACDENNWSDDSTVRDYGGTLYSGAAACGQIGQSYQDYTCEAGSLDEDGNEIDPAELQCEVDNDMETTAETYATWYGAPAALFCTPRSKLPAVPRWDYGGWCPTSGTTWNQAEAFAPPFATMDRGLIHYGPGSKTDKVPPEVLAVKPTYIDYVKGAIDGATGGECMTGQGFTCCMDVDNQRAGQWKSCADGPGGACANPPAPKFGRDARTDVEGCCWWGRGAIQTTGICNFGRLNYFMGKKAASRGRTALYPDVDFCKDPEVICRNDYSDLKWIAGFFYWIDAVQPFASGTKDTALRAGSFAAGSGRRVLNRMRNATQNSALVAGARSHPPNNYMDVLFAWVDNGMRTDDYSLVDLASGLVNRGCAWAEFDHEEPGVSCDTSDGSVPYTPVPCKNGLLHAPCKRRLNFQAIISVLQPAFDYREPTSR